MTESKTIRSFDDIAYYRIFGWKKVGEYHGPANIGSMGIVSCDGVIKSKIQDIDEYYLGRDTKDSRYEDWIQCEKDFVENYNLSIKAKMKADVKIDKKSRKVLLGVSITLLLLSLIAIIFGLLFIISPGFVNSGTDLWTNGDWSSWIIKMSIIATVGVLCAVTSIIVLHKNTKTTLMKPSNRLRQKSIKAYKKAAYLSHIDIDEKTKFVPLS